MSARVTPAAVLLGGLHDGRELAVMPETDRIIVTLAAPPGPGQPSPVAVASVDNDARPATPAEVLYIRTGRQTRERVPVYELARPAPT